MKSNADKNLKKLKVELQTIKEQDHTLALQQKALKASQLVLTAEREALEKRTRVLYSVPLSAQRRQALREEAIALDKRQQDIETERKVLATKRGELEKKRQPLAKRLGALAKRQQDLAAELEKVNKNTRAFKRNREALTSELETIRKQQRAKAKDIAHKKHRDNYILTHRFYVEMGGVIRAAFSECSGFGLDVKKEQYLEGGVNDQQRVMLGHAEFQDTVLKRGMTNDPTFWDWMKEILEGRSVSDQASTSVVRMRRNVNILMMNQGGKIMQLCTLIGAVPIGWRAPAFQADSSAVAIEEMTLAYEGINLKFQSSNKLGAGGATAFASRDVLGFFPES